MGGSSNSNNSSTSQTQLKATQTNNPYTTANTDSQGNTTVTFNDGTALKDVYDFGNTNVTSLLDQYLNPTLDSATNQAKLNSYTKAMNNEARNTLNNSIINPLANNNMIRSSQATNMYNNLNNQLTDKLDDYTTSLIADSQQNSADMINNLLSWYMDGYKVATGEEANSLNASTAGASTKTDTSGKAK